MVGERAQTFYCFRRRIAEFLLTASVLFTPATLEGLCGAVHGGAGFR
jgi:hypothetical protein